MEKDRVIIGGVAFDKNDPRIVLIRRAIDGKGRYYRKSSKHVVRIEFRDTEYAHKDDVIVLADSGKKAPKWSMYVKQIPVVWHEGEEPVLSYVQSSHVESYRGERVHVDDARFTVIGDSLIAKSDSEVCTHPEYHGFRTAKAFIVETPEGTIPIYDAHKVAILNHKTKELEFIYTSIERPQHVQESLFPHGEVLVAGSMYLMLLADPVFKRLKNDWIRMDGRAVEEAKALGLIRDFDWLNNRFYILESAMNKAALDRFEANIGQRGKDPSVITKKIKASLVCQEPEDLENLASVIDDSSKRKTLPGGNVSYDYRIPATVSPTNIMVGGMPYTFGLEFECAAGYLPLPDIARLFSAEIGDRSIRANEYVTPPLHGDVGVRMLMDYCKTLQLHCMIDANCGLHIHVGGAPHSGKTSPPSFNRAFSVMAIKLGVMLESDIFMTQPPARSPMAKHTASIVKNTGAGASGDFSGISADNWRPLLGKYVYGREFDADNNSKRELGKWHDQRYKWLNLCHCNSSSRFKTIEFRIFSGKFDPISVLNELRMAMAFVWFVENKPREILKGNVTLEQVVSAAYKHPYIKHEVLSYIRQRTNIYKRKLY